MKQVKQFILWAVAAFVAVVLAQSTLPVSSAGLDPLTPPHTESPQETLGQFLENTNEAYRLLMAAHEESKQESGLFHSPPVKALAAQAEEAMERAVRTLNLESVPETSKQRVGLESALKLKEILDRIPLPSLDRVPDVNEVTEDPSLVRWEIPKTEIAIVKSQGGQYADEFLFSPDTIQRLKEFYLEVRDLPYQPGASEGFYDFYISTPGNLLPPKWSHWLPHWTTRVYWEQTLWQWFGLAIALALAVFVIAAIYRWRHSSHLDPRSLASAWAGLWLPASIIIIFYCTEIFAIYTLNLTGEVDRIFAIAVEVLLFIVGGWFAFILANAIGRTTISSAYFRQKPLEAAMVRSGFRAIGIVAAATIIYFGGEFLGVPVAPLFASLGVGSLAIGLGAKSYVENIVSGINLFLDRPVQIGDFCEFGGIAGTVENIGLRAVRIRTPDRKIVTVPNSNFSNSEVVNYSQRDRRLLNFRVGLPSTTKHYQVKDVLDKMRSLLAANSGVEEQKVHLVNLGEKSLEIEVFAYILSQRTSEFLDIQEELLLAMMEIVETIDSEGDRSSSVLDGAKDGKKSSPPSTEFLKNWDEKH
ncbi:MAG TPA: mechanosensitive ion channel [Oscillatoriales cyanobacterium M59_W2019_021]|nr:mechanosensitive ion channel [Oscillatoriales cyanobacterium M4454_W2019_049]HIK53230.1 mechanosensitive ion channel [Oscillatoriales cyanobacterium M59_W2019_021]